MKHVLWPASLAMLGLLSPADAADDPATVGTTEIAAANPDREAVELETVVVSGERGSLPQNFPNSSYGVTGTELREQNFLNTEDALRYAPNVTIRKRYIGDRNALIGGRSNSTLQSTRGLVYADGVLLSNFLGTFNAPRWNMVAPEEVSRVDVLYGPYSALYPGNSIGTTVLITTREPRELETSGRAQFFSQHYEDYGYDDDYNGRQFSAFLGDRIGRASFSLGVNRLETRSQPMQHAIGTLITTADDGSGTPVTGAVKDADQKGAARLILGPNGSSIEDDAQNQLKLKAGYDFSRSLHGDLLFGWWRNVYERTGVSLLRDAQGQAVYSGKIRFDGRQYTIPGTSFSPQNGEEEHLMYAATLRTRNDSAWNFSAVASKYNITTDLLRSSTTTPQLAAVGGAGTIADGDGTGWWNLDVQGSWRPDDLPHAVIFGYYLSRYDLENRTYAATNYQGARDAQTGGSFGQTQTQALYIQDLWRFTESWSATIGLRAERWEAYDGLTQGIFSVTDPDTGVTSSQFGSSAFPERSDESLSPKFSLSYAPGGDWSLRYSAGRGVRYPTVSDLFQGSFNGIDIKGFDPNLKPESSISQELSYEKSIGGGSLRASLFQDDIEDTIYSQTDITVTPNVTNIQNIDRVLTRGIELAYTTRGLLLKNLDLNANLALVDSEIKQNRKFPTSEGKHWVRVPDVRANLVANYAWDSGWNLNLAAQHSGRQYNTLDNTDTHPDTYGGTSRYTTVDTRLGYRVGERIDLGIGVQNLFDEHYYVSHPYPGRTYVAELRGSF